MKLKSCLKHASCMLYLGGMKEHELKQSKTKDILLATYSMAKEGLDIPGLDALVLATPRSDVVQACGRILHGKSKNPTIVDIGDQWPIGKAQFNKKKMHIMINLDLQLLHSHNTTIFDLHYTYTLRNYINSIFFIAYKLIATQYFKLQLDKFAQMAELKITEVSLSFDICKAPKLPISNMVPLAVDTRKKETERVVPAGTDVDNLPDWIMKCKSGYLKFA